jgi:hypothetical protein
MAKDRRPFNPGEAIVPGITLAFALAYFIQTRDASAVAIRWPYIIGALTALFWLIIVVRFTFGKLQPVEKIGLKKEEAAGIALILCAPILYIAAIPYLGFGISSFVFLALLFRLLGSTTWLKNFFIAFAVTGFLYISMILLMQMSLPRLSIGPLHI